ncbi:uncharacterized protein LOC135054802 isoform X2 [Pseudophryne corroboree]|uniref:uncharacterized protein LOC135054802 isoform X2 n=1 Tax=Pseudophryne corroboree TaxID=495146 RepID=UPI003081EACA
MMMMMENHQPFTSLDGASNQDTPERCPRPVYSQDCTEENHRTPQEDQGEDLADIKVEDTEGEEETFLRGDQQCKEEKIPTDISTDGASNRDSPERCPRPLYSQDCTEENHRTPQEDQDEGLTDIKIEVIEEKEEGYVRGDQQCKEEEIPTVSTDVVLDKYREFIQGFIEMYRDRECLWRVKSRDYTNKSLRNQALQELVDHSRPYYAAASLEWVRKKIQNLRTVFLKEHKKIQNSWRSSAGTNDLYQPTLWYYNQLLFTLDQEPQRRGLVVMAERETAEEAEDVGETSETLSTPLNERSGSSADCTNELLVSIRTETGRVWLFFSPLKKRPVPLVEKHVRV